MTTGPISLQSLSFESILKDLVLYAKNKPEGLSWQDWLDSSDGQIVAEWIAGLATFRAFHEMMRIRESQLDQAQLASSVFNLAFNKGLLVPPAAAAELLLTVTTPALRSFEEGEFIATMGSYEVYCLEGKTINGQDTLKAVVGHLNQFSEQVPGLKKFQRFQYTSNDEFFAQQMEEFKIDGTKIELLTDPDYLHGVQNDFLLRRIMPGQSRVYIGNGTIGLYVPNATLIEYNVLTYGADITTALTSPPRILFTGVLNAWEVTLQPSFDPDKEEVREIARFYPIDGRVVQDHDYEVILKKNFGGIVKDIYAFNTDPNEEIYILKDEPFGTGPQEVEYVDRMKALINSKRGMGILVNYNMREMTDGKVFTCAMQVPEDSYSNDLVVSANAYLAERLYTFQRASVSYTALKVAVDLSSKFGIQFYPTGSESITLAATDYFKQFNITVTSI